MCHSRTANLEEEVKRADIVVAALGKAEFIKVRASTPVRVCLSVLALGFIANCLFQF